MRVIVDWGEEPPARVFMPATSVIIGVSPPGTDTTVSPIIGLSYPILYAGILELAFGLMATQRRQPLVAIYESRYGGYALEVLFPLAPTPIMRMMLLRHTSHKVFSGADPPTVGLLSRHPYKLNPAFEAFERCYELEGTLTLSIAYSGRQMAPAFAKFPLSELRREPQFSS